MTLNEVAEMYYDLKKGLMKPSSYASSQNLYKNHIKEYLGNIDIEKLNNRELQKFYNSLVHREMKRKYDNGKTLSLRVAQDIIGLIKTFLYFAMEEGEMSERVFKLKKPYGFRIADNGQDEYLGEEYYKKVVQECCDITECHFRQAKIFTLIAITTGMRIGEVCGLQWENIDFANNRIEVKKTVQRIVNPDGKSFIHIGEPKTKSSQRTCMMLDIVKNVLLKYKEILGIDNEKTYILTGKLKPTEPRTVRQGYQRFLKKIEIPYIHPHALRHTFCTYSINGGGDIKTISMLLGHANTGITLDTYTHITKKQLEKTENCLNNIFSTK